MGGGGCEQRRVATRSPRERVAGHVWPGARIDARMCIADTGGRGADGKHGAVDGSTVKLIDAAVHQAVHSEEGAIRRDVQVCPCARAGPVMLSRALALAPSHPLSLVLYMERGRGSD